MLPGFVHSSFWHTDIQSRRLIRPVHLNSGVRVWDPPMTTCGLPDSYPFPYSCSRTQVRSDDRHSYGKTLSRGATFRSSFTPAWPDFISWRSSDSRCSSFDRLTIPLSVTLGRF